MSIKWTEKDFYRFYPKKNFCTPWTLKQLNVSSWAKGTRTMDPGAQHRILDNVRYLPCSPVKRSPLRAGPSPGLAAGSGRRTGHQSQAAEAQPWEHEVIEMKRKYIMQGHDLIFFPLSSKWGIQLTRKDWIRAALPKADCPCWAVLSTNAFSTCRSLLSMGRNCS